MDPKATNPEQGVSNQGVSTQGVSTQGVSTQDTSKTTTQSDSVKLSSSEILKRASESMSKETAKESQATQNTSSSEVPASLFDRSELVSQIKDPYARKQVEDYLSRKEKDMLRGMNDKFQEAARIRKEAEDRLSKTADFTKLSPAEKLKLIQQDQSFIEYAQAEAQRQQAQSAPSNWDGTQEEWSALSDKERIEFKSLRTEINELKQMERMRLLDQADKEIATRLPGYDPQLVNSFQSDLGQGKFSEPQLREMIAKAHLFDSAVERAYQQGLEDRKMDVNAKISATTGFHNARTELSQNIPQKESGETSRNHFIRIAQQRLAQLAR